MVERHAEWIAAGTVAAMTGKVTGSAPGEPQILVHRSRWAVIVGLTAEARLVHALRAPVFVGGGTAQGAELACRRAVAGGAAALVSLGLAGGLDPALRPGVVIVPERVLAGGTSLASDPAINRAIGGPTAHRLVGADTVAADAATKQRLWRETGAAALDLESGAVARIATEHGLPFAVLRVICDPAERDLPPAALAALDGRGVIGIARVLGSVLAHPAQLPGLLALARDAAIARRALAARIASIAGGA
jgi:adenosylhomocysteine nucleosidase